MSITSNIEDHNNNLLRAECTNPRIEWNKQSPCHGGWAEWKGFIRSNTKAVWHTLSDDQKFALAKDALELAKEDYDNHLDF